MKITNGRGEIVTLAIGSLLQPAALRLARSQKGAVSAEAALASGRGCSVVWRSSTSPEPPRQRPVLGQFGSVEIEASLGSHRQLFPNGLCAGSMSSVAVRQKL